MCSCVFLCEYYFASRLSTYRNSDNYEATYEYDKDNNVIEKTEELGNKYTYNYEYNNDNSLTKLTNNNSTFNYKYDLLGRLEEQNINDVYKTNYSYITRTYKTSTMIDKVDDNGTEYSYTYDKLGNITEIRKNNTLTNKYYYDEYSELIKEDDLVNNVTKQYVYDNFGNILSKKTYTYNTTNLISEDKYEYNSSNWQDLLTKFNNEQITYDEIGNPLSIGNKTLTWMNGRELSTYSDGTNNISYKYNLNGIRTSKTVNGIKTNYILEGTSIIFEDRNGDVIYYIYNGDEILGFIYNSKTYYYHKNMFGDIIGILDSNYNEIVSYEYDSWGALVNITDNSNINLGTVNPFRYRSYYYDTETGLYYLNSRYYNPQIGRFINADGIIASNNDYISNNLFTYVSNDFVNFSDKLGKGIWEFVKVIADAFRTLAPVYGGSATAAASDGPLPIGDILGTIYSVGKTIEYFSKVSERDLVYDSSKDITQNNNKGRDETIYALSRNGEVFYVGRTCNLDRRIDEHRRTKAPFDPNPLILNVVNSNISPLEEQRWIDYYETLRCGKPNCNRRYEISPKGKRAGEYLYYKKEFDLATGDTGTYIGGCLC